MKQEQNHSTGPGWSQAGSQTGNPGSLEPDHLPATTPEPEPPGKLTFCGGS